MTLKRRLQRLEDATGHNLPWHLPMERWTDAQLLALAAPGRRDATDDDLGAIIASGENDQEWPLRT